MPQAPSAFGEFYVAYLEQHRHPLNRLLHLLAKVLALAALILALLRRSPLLLLAAPLLFVLPCWVGHFLWERNRPTSWTQPEASLLGSLRYWRRAAPAPAGRPFYSVLADLRMCGAMLTGSLPSAPSDPT
jgi:hypothetical protein